MRIGTDGQFHLTYCSNIHPGEHWPEVFANLKTYIPPLKSRFAPKNPFGIGLRLANPASQELLEEDALPRFKEWLDQNDLYVFTLNGFPYGGFHRQVVKEAVYTPDWMTTERQTYTVRLAKILAALLPEEIDGGISSVPVSYKPWFKKKAERERDSCLEQSSIQLARTVQALMELQNESEKWIHLDLEPEPDGMLENSTDVIEFFQDWLLPKGGAHLAKTLGITATQAQEHILRHIGVCYDTCHFAVSYEKPHEVLERFKQAGIRIGKIQISAALKFKLPASAQARQSALERLEPFAESTYLHQVVEKRSDGTLHTYSDLIDALPHLSKTPGQEWRIHFHVPIFVEDYHTVQSTQEDIKTVLKLLEANPVCPHLEIETYTWEVLPAEMKMDLSASIGREYEWVLSHISG